MLEKFIERFKGRSSKERIRNTQELERYAEEMIYFFYAKSQRNYSEAAQAMRSLSHSTSGLKTDLFRESLARARFDSMQHVGRFSDQLIGVLEEQLFDRAQIAPERRAEIKIKGLGLALSYWEVRLMQPDLTPEELIYGRQRKNHIQLKLDALTDPDVKS